MRTRVLAVGLFVVIGLMVLPAAAQAASPKVKLTPNVGPPTTKVKAKGSHYPGGDPVTVTLDGSPVASATTSAAGAFSASFTIPATALPGAHTVAANAGGVVATAVFTVETDWGSARYDPEGSGFNPYENVLSPDNVGRLLNVASPTWGGAVSSEPIFTGGLLVVGSSDGSVRAFAPAGGMAPRVRPDQARWAQQWSFQTGGPVMGSPLSVLRKAGEQCAIVAGSLDGNLYGLDPRTGDQLWSFNAGSPISTSPIDPTAVEDVYFSTDGGTVFDVNGCTGEQIWSTATGGGTGGAPAFVPAVQLSGGTKGSIIVVCMGDGSVRALDAGDGTQVWSVSPPNPCSAPLAAFGSGGKARIVGGCGGWVWELNAATGGEVWSYQTGGTVSGIGLYSIPILPGSVTPNMKLSLRGIIVVDQAGDMYSLSATGKINWGDVESGNISSPPAIANGVIYETLGATPGAPASLMLVDAEDGTGLGQDFVSNPQPDPPGDSSVADGMVFVGNFNGGVGVFELGP